MFTLWICLCFSTMLYTPGEAHIPGLQCLFLKYLNIDIYDHCAVLILILRSGFLFCFVFCLLFFSSIKMHLK